MSIKKVVISLAIALLSVALVVLALMFLFKDSQALLSAFTQNFQNIAMPLITMISVAFLYSSIQENTKQTSESARQNKIARIDELIAGHVDALETLFKVRVSDMPYVVKYILSDYGDDNELEKDWDVKTLILQSNAYLSIEPQLAIKNVKAAIYDYLRDDCLIDGERLSYKLSVLLDDIASLLSQRASLEEDINRNFYVWKKLAGIAPVLAYTQEYDEDSFNKLQKLNLGREIDIRKPDCQHAQSISAFVDRVSKLDALKALEILEIRTEEEMKARLGEDKVDSAA